MTKQYSNYQSTDKEKGTEKGREEGVALTGFKPYYYRPIKLTQSSLNSSRGLESRFSPSCLSGEILWVTICFPTQQVPFEMESILKTLIASHSGKFFPLIALFRRHVDHFEHLVPLKCVI